MAEWGIMLEVPHILSVFLQASIIVAPTQASLFCNKQKLTQAGLLLLFSH